MWLLKIWNPPMSVKKFVLKPLLTIRTPNEGLLVVSFRPMSKSSNINIPIAPRSLPEASTLDKDRCDCAILFQASHSIISSDLWLFLILLTHSSISWTLSSEYYLIYFLLFEYIQYVPSENNEGSTFTIIDKFVNEFSSSPVWSPDKFLVRYRIIEYIFPNTT